MKMVFLCGCLEPGKDGVGDYTRLLADELIRQGHEVTAIALYDRFVTSNTSELQSTRTGKIDVLRIPFDYPLDKRIAEVRARIDAIQPQWVSLQYVPYAFHHKGLAFQLVKELKSLELKVRWHIMFHEIWPGITRRSPLMHKVYGFMQRRVAKALISALQPKLMTTSNRLYQLILAQSNIKVQLLPLFSNIAVHEDAGKLSALCNDLQIDKTNAYVLGIFGTLHPQAKLEGILKEYKQLAVNQQKELVFLSVGKIGTEGAAEFGRLKQALGGEIRLVQLGIQPDEQLSLLFQLMDKGISCTPFEHLGKSGAYAAMRFHGVEVLTPVSDPVPEYENEIKEYNNILFSRKPQEWGVEHVAASFLKLLNTYD